MLESAKVKQYDLIIIGTGTAAISVATRIREAGKTVAVIDFRPYGGTCALRGCDPKKMLISGVEVIDEWHRMKSRGIEGQIQIDWAKLIQFKSTFTDPVPEKRIKLLKEKGIHSYHGRAQFSGQDTVQVNGELLRAKNILIASGAEPKMPGIPGEEYLITNEEFLSLKSLPRRIVLVGGGYVAAEFSHIAARSGAQVTILQRGQRILERFEPELVDWLMEKFHEIGVNVRTQTAVTSIRKMENSFEVQTESNGQSESIEADLVIHAAGRVPALSGLNLGAARIEVEKGRLKLNEYLQSTSNSLIYAAGDAAQMGPPLTPVSSHDAKVVAANILEGNHVKPNYQAIPSVAFTIPPIASVGLSETEAKSKGIKYRKIVQKASDWFTAHQKAESVYGFKVLIDKSTDLILGAHLVGPGVDEVINLFTLAIRHGLTAHDLKSTMFAYPTGASDIGYMV